MHTAPFRLMPTRLLSTMDVNRETLEDDLNKQKRAALTKGAWAVVNTGVKLGHLPPEKATQALVDEVVDQLMEG